MLCRNIARLASAVTTSMRTERCPRENAHRWRRLSTTIPNSYFGREVFVSSCSSGRRATPKRGESSVLRSQLNISLHRNHRLPRVSRPTLRRRSSLLPRVHRYIEIAYSLCKEQPPANHPPNLLLYRHGHDQPTFFFCCIAELAIRPCRSSRSKLRGEFGIPNTCKTGNKNTTKQQTPPNPKHNTKQKTGKCLECETRGEKRVKRPKRPNALICRTPGGSMRYPLSSSLGMMLISHSVVSIPASPSRFAI